MKGTIANVIADKGFGFINGEDGAQYFFHRSEFNGFFDDLVQDMEKKKIAVTFERTESIKGPRAKEVNRIDGGMQTD